MDKICEFCMINFDCKFCGEDLNPTEVCEGPIPPDYLYDQDFDD